MVGLGGGYELSSTRWRFQQDASKSKHNNKASLRLSQAKSEQAWSSAIESFLMKSSRQLPTPSAQNKPWNH
jgi:hypothetical protein